MNTIERLTALFEKFPGIGPRQAERFVQFLLRSSPAFRRELVESVESLTKTAHQCASCFRYSSEDGKVCSICTSQKRDSALLAVAASDADLTAFEKSGTYRGKYFVLGGTISLGSQTSNTLRTKQLLASIPARIKNGLKEVVLAFPANPEGDATAVRVREALSEKFPRLTITALGRGLSTGSELEYADPETIQAALESRR